MKIETLTRQGYYRKNDCLHGYGMYNYSEDNSMRDKSQRTTGMDKDSCSILMENHMKELS